MEGTIMEDGTKIRKRGCSPSSSTTSSVIHGYKFKKAILVGKRRGGSSTPVPTWRMVGSCSPSLILRAAAATAVSPRYPPSLSGKWKSGEGPPPVSARKLAATLWELNELPSASPTARREKVKRSVVNSGSTLPPHLSDPSHSPASSVQRMERSGTVGHRRRDSTMSRRTKVDNFDSRSDASFTEIETRSRCQTPSASTIAGAKTRLKDVSNALTTSKELLRIITRLWNHDDQPSSTISVISALHSELERARLQINQLIQEERSETKEVNYLLKRFSEEKVAWKSKEQEVVEAAVESIAGKLEVERKLRKRFESLNKKIGKELAVTRTALQKSMKKLDSIKRGNGKLEEEEREESSSTDDGGSSRESDLHSIDLSTQNEEIIGKKSFVNQGARRSTSIMLRTASDVVEWAKGLNYEAHEQVPRRSCGDERPRCKPARGSRLGLERELVSPFSQKGPPWPTRDPCDGSGMGGRVEEAIVEGYYNNLRRSRR